MSCVYLSLLADDPLHIWVGHLPSRDVASSHQSQVGEHGLVVGRSAQEDAVGREQEDERVLPRVRGAQKHGHRDQVQLAGCGGETPTRKPPPGGP